MQDRRIAKLRRRQTVLLDEDLQAAIAATICLAIRRNRRPRCRRCTWSTSGWATCRPQAVVEVAELLGLAPAQVQDTFSFYGFFKQDKPQGKYRVWVCRSISCAACGGEELLEHLAREAGHPPRRNHGRRPRHAGVRRMPGGLRRAPAMLVNDALHKNLTKEKIDGFVSELKRRRIE